ncbi:MAG: hypothetical protein GY820_12600 [Gammaproteobacteria bacterium]|nr:hypothetical protein [Gammaproteobacteria bacterium]
MEVLLVKNLSKENAAQVFPLAWKHDLESLLHACFKVMGLDGVKETQEWKEALGGKRTFMAELIKKF